MTPEEKKKRKAEYAKEWRKRNPEKVKEHSRRTRIKNQEKVQARQRLWREQNAEHVKEYGQKRYQENKERIKDSQLRRLFGISLTDYRELLKKQDGRCAICLTDNPKDAMKRGEYFSVDHNHETKKVRGLLCNSCNVGLGHFGDDVEHLKSAIDYLIRYREDV